MNIVVGLGNPGTIYQKTRHNVGFAVVKDLSAALGGDAFSFKKKLKSEIAKTEKNIFVLPQTFMNGSGFAVQSVLNFYADSNLETIKNVYVVHDDLDISLGEYKIKFGNGPAGHNGLLSIYQHLGTKNFWHVRVGIDTRAGSRTMQPATYVLQRFNPDETLKFNQVKMKVVDKLKNILQN